MWYAVQTAFLNGYGIVRAGMDDQHRPNPLAEAEKEGNNVVVTDPKNELTGAGL